MAHTATVCQIHKLHKTAMNMILLINAELAKAFVTCPELVGHIDVFVASW